jgi:hypothetical protein
MILYKKEPYRLQMKNIMLLDDVESKGCVYVSKATYDQALMLQSRFDGDTQRVINAIKTKKTEIYITNAGLRSTIEKMAKTMPEPINMLAPFLMYCAQNQGLEWDAENREMAYGILHQLSQLIDFNATTLVPVEIRTNLTIPTALLKQYEASWDDLCSTLEDKVVLAAPVIAQSVSVQPTQQTQESIKPEQPAQTQSVVHQAKPVEAPAPQPKVEEEEDPIVKKLRELKKKSDAEFEEMKKKEAKQDSQPKPSASAPAKTQMLGEKKNEAAAANAVLDEFDV